jgi:hypothetical protein
LSSEAEKPANATFTPHWRKPFDLMLDNVSADATDAVSVSDAIPAAIANDFILMVSTLFFVKHLRHGLPTRELTRHREPFRIVTANGISARLARARSVMELIAF